MPDLMPMMSPLEVQHCSLLELVFQYHTLELHALCVHHEVDSVSEYLLLILFIDRKYTLHSE